jgi:hypothetical protein
MKVKISLVVVLATLVATSCVFADGYNMVSWPLIPADTAIQPVMADSMGNGVQLTGGNTSLTSDQIKYFDGISIWYTAWYKSSTPPPGALGWKGDLTTIDPDRGYWIIIRTANPAVTLTMTGGVNTTGRTITVQPGLSFNFVGSAWAVARAIKGAGDDCGLLASGFTGGNTSLTSDQIKYFDGAAWYTAWYKTTTPPPGALGWKGQLSSTQVAGDPYLEPGNGYILIVQAGHAFVGNTWTYPPPPPAKGVKADLSSKTRAPVKIKLDQSKRQLHGPTTSQRLVPEKEAEAKRTR